MIDVKAKLNRLFYLPVVTAEVPVDLQNKIEEYYTPYIPTEILPEDKDRQQATDFHSERTYVLYPSLNEIIVKLAQKMLAEELFTRGGIDIESVHVAEIWIQNYHKGHFHNVHQHPESLVAGTYVIRSNDKGGCLVLNDTNITRSYITDVPAMHSIPPKRGGICLFPAWTPHHVLPSYEEDVERTVLAFNIIAKRTNI